MTMTIMTMRMMTMMMFPVDSMFFFLFSSTTFIDTLLLSLSIGKNIST
jgi:hypothetical protein